MQKSTVYRFPVKCNGSVSFSVTGATVKEARLAVNGVLMSKLSAESCSSGELPFLDKPFHSDLLEDAEALVVIDSTEGVPALSMHRVGEQLQWSDKLVEPFCQKVIAQSVNGAVEKTLMYTKGWCYFVKH